MKTGLVLEGGAMRGMFTAGVLDYLLEQDVHFDYVIGVSAGSVNGMDFVSRQIGRTKKVISHEDVISYCGKDQLARSHKFLNLDTFIKQYALEDFPFDFETFDNSKTEFETTVLNCETGKPEYHGDFANRQEFFDFNAASCSLPFLCQPREIRGQHYLDGSLVDSIPLKHAIEDKGCDRVLIVLTKPESGSPTDYNKLKLFIDRAYAQYPNLSESICNRLVFYKEQTDYMKKKVSEGKAMVVRPLKQYVRHYDNNTKRLDKCYNHGHGLMARRFNDLTKFLKS